MEPPTPASRPRKTRRWRLAAGALVVYLLVMLFGGCADSLLLHPSRQPIGNSATRMLLPRPGLELEVWTQRTKAQEPKAFVLVFSGNGSRAESEVGAAAWRWEQVPVEIWAVNYPGFGGSSGAAKLSTIAPAALLAYDTLKITANGRPIFVQGHSMGTTAALYVASRRPCAGVVLENPPPLKRLILGRYGWWNLWLLAGPVAAQVPSDLDSLRTAPLVKVPALFVLSDHDDLIPPAYHAMVVDAYGGPHQTIVLPNAGHNDYPREPQQKAIEAAVAQMFNDALSRQADGK